MSCRLQAYVSKTWKDILGGLVSTPKSLIGNIDMYLLYCRLFLIRGHRVLHGFNFSLFVDIKDWAEAKQDCKPFSVAVESALMKRKLAAGYHHHKGGED